MPLTIEDASIHQLDELCRIETECFKQEAFTRPQMAHLLKNYDCIGLVAKDGNNIAGFCIASIHKEASSFIGHVLTIDVLPEHRRKGVAARLLKEMEKLLKNRRVRLCRLEVREDNTAAIRLYERLGYTKTGSLKNYYRNSHGLSMEKALT